MKIYKDKHGKRISEGMFIQRKGKQEQVYRTTDANGNDDLGILLTSKRFAELHPSWELEYISLSEIGLNEWEVTAPVKRAMLVYVCDREIHVSFYPSAAEAQQAMRKEFGEASGIDPDSPDEDDVATRGTHWECAENTAFVTDGNNHSDYDWLVVELPEGD